MPLYHQLQAVLKAEIESRKWLPGEQLPNEASLAQRFGVSKITVRQALQELANLGYIRREHGRGTFVERRKFDEGPRELTSFTEEMRRHDLVATSRIMLQTIMEADAKAAEALRVPLKSPVYVLKRVRLAGCEPMSLQTAHIPYALVPGLVVGEDHSLYGLLQSRYQLYAAHAREVYFASVAQSPSAELLKVAPGAPVFGVERVTFLSNDKPFEFVQSIVRGDLYKVVLDLIKEGAQSGSCVGALQRS
jgi:GntR family transcriptional regulator